MHVPGTCVDVISSFHHPTNNLDYDLRGAWMSFAREGNNLRLVLEIIIVEESVCGSVQGMC